MIVPYNSNKFDIEAHKRNIILSKGDGEKKTAVIKLCQFINAALLVLILPPMLLFEWVKPFLPKKSRS